MSLYETPKLVAEYLLFHYGDADAVLGRLPGPRDAVAFAQRLVRELLDPALLPEGAGALDVGCAVGGSAFELTRSCERVHGIDFSQAFISAAQALAEQGELGFEKIIEGTISESDTARVPADCNASRATFAVGDACDLASDLGSFDVVLAANLICRLPEPGKFFERLPALVRPGGQLLLTTPFTWMDDYTPRDQWVGATPGTGTSFDALQSILAPNFDLQHRVDIPFLIREHSRKFQYTVALGSRWIRR